jgi:hypothetical protein
MGTVSAVVHDSVAVLPAGHTSPTPTDTMSYAGTVSGSTQVEIYSTTGGWQSLGAATDAAFLIYCWNAAVPFVDVSVPTGTYSRVRLTLTGYEALITAGAVIKGVSYTDELTIALGTGGSSVVIEKDVTPFSVTTSNDLSIIFDLNSELWLNGGVVAAGSASQASIAAATNVFVR